MKWVWVSPGGGDFDKEKSFTAHAFGIRAEG